MTSSMMAGERRGTSVRRGGMVVLGKVAVPRPLNLPSQRLENHGMDPTVEIVPKGTLSWGSRSSSSTSNAWGSSTFSPKADGGTSSPSHLSGRPSSGSGTRPSSSCSDRTHEPNSNTRGQCSRPSSASGALTSNQTSLASLRPRSAETRPGSSHLSRFAETSSDISGAWGSTGISKKLDVASSKNDGFSLSSGDFPTLGSEKENSERSTDSKGDNSMNASVTVNTWRSDGPQHVEDGMLRPPVEKWRGDPLPYLNSNITPQHFDAWHDPPLNPPPGVWYRGPPGGPPYATPLGPGGFAMDPFPYYRPQIPPSTLANPQPVPPPGAGPRGHHSKNGDMYRPHIPDGYVRSGMPIRPGFYPGPVPYEGYYGPPMGYCNSSKRDSPFMGMPAGPPIYSRYPGENAPPEPGNNHARAGPHGSTGRVPVSEQMESGPEDARGPCKVLLKQQNEWDEKWTEDKWKHPLPDNVHPGKGDPPRKSLQKNEWGSEDKKDDEIYSGRRILGGDEISSQNYDNQGRYSSDLPENRDKAETVDRRSVHKLENAASTFSQAPKVFPSTSKDSTLIRKIEGLNAKAWSSDGRPDAASAPNREEQRSRSEVADAKVNHLKNEAGTIYERINTTASPVPASREVDILTADSSLFSTASSGTTVSRASHGVQGRFDHHGKRFNTQDADGRRKKLLGAESTVVVSALSSETNSNVPPQGLFPSVIAAEKYVINLQEKDEGESMTPIFDPSVCQEQHAKMREIAKQRALQPQKEEEERIREQKAKALAKLEELNRRTQAVDGSIQKMEKAPPSVSTQQEKEVCRVLAEQVMVASKSETLTPELDSNPNAQITNSSATGDTELTDLSNATPIEMSENVQLKQAVPHPASVAEPKAATQVNEEGSILRNKHMGNKQRHNSSLGGNLMEKSVPISSTEAQKNNADVAVNDVASTEAVSGEVDPTRELGLPINTNILAGYSAHQRRKNNRSSKNKHKLYEVPPVAALVPKETNAEKASLESGMLQSSELELDPSSIQPSEQQWTSLPTEEPSGRANSRWRSHHTRRMTKSQPANRIAEKEAVIWAPVRSDKKTEFIDDADNRTLPETVISTAKGDNVIHNYAKSKRAEMERYVPKPVAKGQLAQQTLLDETVESSQIVNLTIGNIVCTVESAKENGKQNKQSKVHGSWRQRGLLDGSFSISDPSQNIQESIEQQEPSLKPEVNSMKNKTKLSDDWNASDGWNNCENSDTAAPVSSTVVKDQGVITGRGKRHPFQGPRNVSSGDTDKSSSQIRAPDIVGQTDKSSTSKDNRATSHWQPKSQVSAFPGQRGNRTGGGGQSATAAEIKNPIKKDLQSQDRVQMAPDHNKNRGEHTVDPSNDQSVLEEKNEVVAPNVGHQESKREKVDSFRGQPIPRNQSSVVYASDSIPPPSGDAQYEQHYLSSGFQKNGNQNNRSGRVHESRGDWSLGGQDNRQHNNTSSSGERQRHNSHYEYQPIGQQNYSKSNNFEGPTDGSPNPGSRYRARSQGYSRHGEGNFNNRQGGTVHVEASCD